MDIKPDNIFFGKKYLFKYGMVVVFAFNFLWAADGMVKSPYLAEIGSPWLFETFLGGITK
jgi:hypothetical protein